MTKLDKNKIYEAARKYADSRRKMLPGPASSITCFTAGAEWALSEVENKGVDCNGR